MVLVERTHMKKMAAIIVNMDLFNSFENPVYILDILETCSSSYGTYYVQQGCQRLADPRFLAVCLESLKNSLFASKIPLKFTIFS